MPPTLKPSTDELRLYEIAVLLPADLNDKEKREAINGVEDIFKEKDIKVLHTDEWKKIGLAYRIKGNTHGQYIIFYAEGSPGAIKELDAPIRFEKNVLRHLIVKLPVPYEIVDWTAHYAEWKESKEKEVEERVKEQEEEKKRKIIQRATKKSPIKKVPSEEKEPEAVEEAELEEKISELVSDEDLNL